MCSRCGFLCHGHCLRDFMEDDKNNSTFKNICPRCGRSSVQLTSSFTSGYRNFGVILRHRGYACDNFPQSFTTHNYDHVTTIYNGASTDSNHLCSIANDNEPNFSTNAFGSPTRFPLEMFNEAATTKQNEMTHATTPAQGLMHLTLQTKYICVMHVANTTESAQSKFCCSFLLTAQKAMRRPS